MENINKDAANQETTDQKVKGSTLFGCTTDARLAQHFTTSHCDHEDALVVMMSLKQTLNFLPSQVVRQRFLAAEGGLDDRALLLL
jgi:hypothetical protein